MNFNEMCKKYLEVSNSLDVGIKVRRRIWPQNVYALLGDMSVGSSPVVCVLMRDHPKPRHASFGMNLVMNGEKVILGWCPSIEDVSAQDWEFI